jgi:hypothetical protein
VVDALRVEELVGKDLLGSIKYSVLNIAGDKGNPN